VAGFLELDRSVAGEELAVFERTEAGAVAIGARLRSVDGARLPGGRRLAKLPRDRAADVVGTLLDGGEIEVVEGVVGAEEVRGNRLEDLLEAGVEGGIRR